MTDAIYLPLPKRRAGRYIAGVTRFPPHRFLPALALLFAATLLSTGASAQSNAAQLSSALRAKQIDIRLKAIDDLVASDLETSERLLTPLLSDKDWEVQEHIAHALGKLGELGKVKTKSSLNKLISLAMDGPTVRVRRAAAVAVSLINAEEGAKSIFKKAKSKRQVAALEALAIVLRAQPKFGGADKIKKLITAKHPSLREAAARAWFEAAPDRAAAFNTLLVNGYLGIRCLALEAVEESPRKEDLTAVTILFSGSGQNEVVARRIVRALAAVIAASDGDRAGVARTVLAASGTKDTTLIRRAALVPLLCQGEKPIFNKKDGVAALLPCFRSKEIRPRAAAAKALREIGGEEALAAALKQFKREDSGRAQLQLVETVAALRKPTTPDAVAWLVKIVRGEYDTEVRERAVVRLGKSGVKGATDALVEATRHRKWTIACCAAVSLGKTDHDKALEPLKRMLAMGDWKLRGAAVIGLMHMSRDAVVDPIVKMLDDKHPVVANAAHEALRTMSRHFIAKNNRKAWLQWWHDNRKNHDFTDREASLDKLDKYGYAVPDTEIYNGLDVVVYKSPFKDRGDHIEQLLESLKIEHRTTEQSQVLEDGVHPEAIFVSNCTGELSPEDVDPLKWFVRTGGSLFGSCWALTETIARLHPGVMQKFETPQQVLDTVRARPCRPDSPLLTGVFPPSVVPIYHLEGAHLIQVLDPERCEVLIDSPDAAERHGCGNLAAWFFSGHGVMFDSANHFDLQGLGVAGAGALRTPADRQAYAMDHLGMSYKTWRKVRTDSYWRSPTKSTANVPDLSAFRLLTNFVRSKRIGKY
ncbi:MAG: HEAT repeat protein [Planctomycetota bacterium]